MFTALHPEIYIGELVKKKKFNLAIYLDIERKIQKIITP
jgi:hypothetical protein